MGSFSRLLLLVWLVACLVVSLSFTAKRSVIIGVRILQLRNQTCLEDTVWWPTWAMLFACITCIVGLIACICRIRILASFFSFLLNLGFIFLMLLMIWRLFMFGWVRKPARTSFENVYLNNSPLSEEYKPMLRESKAGPKAWGKVEECMTKLQFCDEVSPPKRILNDKDWKIEDHYQYFKEGCCIRPPRCTHHISVFKGVDHDDCSKWVNATKPTNSKCYECDSCKAARIATYQTNQVKVYLYNLVFAIFTIVSSLLVTFGALD